MQQNLPRASALGVVAVLGVFAVVTAARAAEDPGKAAYLRYCAACHGEDGKGDGLVGSFLRPKPTDLTLIAKKAGGQFPIARVEQVIDGRAAIGAHGKSDMPVWGEVFREEAGESPAAEAMARSKVPLITDYIRTLQVK